MNKVVWQVLTVVVAVAVFYGIKAQQDRNRVPSAAEIATQMDALRAEAERKHPGMAKTDAMKAEAVEKSAQRMASQSPDDRANSAADMFFGFYLLNTKARVAYCAKRNVDIAPFVTAFTTTHKDELVRAQAIYAKAGLVPEKHLANFQDQFAVVVEQDMKDVTAGAQVPLEDACTLFNEHAQAFSEALELPPHVKAALMGQAAT